MDSLLREALRYSSLGFKVFPLSPFSKIPLKGSSGFKDATTDETIIIEWFTKIEPLANIGISLLDTPYFVLDCDRNHADGQDGIDALLELFDGKGSLENVVIVKTVNNGVHLYFKAPNGTEIKQQIGFKNGIDVIKNFIVAPSSRVKRKDGTIGTYELLNGSLDSIKECPPFLLEAITGSQQAKGSNISYNRKFISTEQTKKYTGILLEEIVQGANESQRNDFLTRMIGKFLYLGMDSEKAYELMLVVNENFVYPSLSNMEVNKIFKSILKAESNKKGVVN